MTSLTEAGRDTAGPRGRLLWDDDLAAALGVPLTIARAFVKHQRIDGTLTDDGRCGAYEVEVAAWHAAHPD